jgi:hypothetical protein
LPRSDPVALLIELRVLPLLVLTSLTAFEAPDAPDSVFVLLLGTGVGKGKVGRSLPGSSISPSSSSSLTLLGILPFLIAALVSYFGSSTRSSV